MSTFDFSPMLRYSVGFDRMQRQIATASARTEATYPPYNIETNDKDAYRVTVAVAGFEKDDLDITLEDDKLNITGKKEDEDGNMEEKCVAGNDLGATFNADKYVKTFFNGLEI